MTHEPARTPENDKLSSLRASRFAVRAAMLAERLWPLVLPFLLVVTFFLSASWFGLFRGISEPVRLGLLAIFALAGLGALLLLRRLRPPTPDEIDRRLEAANALEHTPVQVQFERPGGKADGFAEALWREHQRRMAEKLQVLGGDLPRPNIPAHDRWALRTLPILALAVGYAFSYGSMGGRLTDAFQPGAGVVAIPPRIDAWVTPPGYTGKPPIFLTSEANQDSTTFTVPAGSELALRVTGGSGNETLGLITPAGERIVDPRESPVPEPAVGAGNRQFVTKIVGDGEVLLREGDSRIAGWNFKTIPDTPPSIHFVGEPLQALNGTLEVQYEIRDDYGATSANADFELSEAPSPQAEPIYGKPELKLVLPRRGAILPTAKVSRDLTDHVWAGSKVRLTLQATDAAGQTSLSETKEFILPERPFTNPLARAVVEQRKIFALDANRKPEALDLIEAITLRPEDTFDSLSHYLGLMVAKSMLASADSDEQLRSTADYFWELALGIENGELSSAEMRLKQAREALKQALERGASDAEIDKLMKELREAMNEYLREFAERAQRDPNMQAQQTERTLSDRDLQKMLDDIEKQAKSGNREAAEDLLAQLENLMNNLQMARPQQGDNSQQSEMRQQMNKLGDIMRRQQEMMNETHRLDQRQQQSEQGMNSQQPMTPEEFADAMKQLQEGQGKLQSELEQLMKGLEGMGIQPGQGFGEAGKQMGEAQGALGENEGQRATGHQGQALEALRRGAQDMMQQMQQAMQGEQGNGQEGGRQQSSDRDPLGRPRATRGPDDGDTTRVPDEIDAQRARQILEAIRKRLGNALSPELERSYLERLLEMR
ncbi:MAG: TIGR02302 family protein [Rhizobiaceae bacterium]|nr:TIGR02302 family protein [Rhizobiaceae bacterium]